MVCHLGFSKPFPVLFANAPRGCHLFFVVDATRSDYGVLEPLLIRAPFAVNALYEFIVLCHKSRYKDSQTLCKVTKNVAIR